MMTGRGGWPMSVFLTPELASRSSAARTGRRGRAAACRASTRCCRPWPTPGSTAATRSLEQADEMTRAAARAATADAAAGEPAELDRRPAGSGRGGAAAGVRSAARRLRPGAEVSAAAWTCGVLLRRWRRTGRRRSCCDMVTHHARPHGRRRHLRSPRRRLPSLQRRRPLAGAALREDALRQRPAGRLLPRGLAGDRQGPTTPRVVRRDARLSCSAT